MFWKINDRVLAQRPPENFFYPGVIRHIQDDRYFVIFDDGEDSFVQALEMAPLKLDIGDRVFAYVPAARDFQPARIIDKQEDQIQVQFEQGGLAWTSTAKLRLQPQTKKTQALAVRSPADWRLGHRVFACWMDLFWYSGSVLGVDGDRVSVVFDHGGHAVLPASQVRALDLEEGDPVWGRYQAGAEFFTGKVARRDGEIVEIHYDDGDQETTLIRLLRLERDEWLPDLEPPDLGTGDRVLACWFDGFWYPGVILAIEGKRVHVLFDDNDQAHLTWDKVGPLEVHVGDKVFCRWKGGPFYHPGQIVRQKGERLFIQYEDGRDEWTSVRLIRLER